jgi:ADP-ribose pyrophosphatase YjhB (NUDIX family)
MLFRHCAGGVVFSGEKVLLLQNDKQEWSLPKGVIRHNLAADEVALMRVKDEAGVDAKIIDSAGETSYQFYSLSRQRSVCNIITWFVMKANEEKFCIATEQGFLDGGFFKLDEALNLLTHSQEKSLVRISHQKAKHLIQIGA